MDDETLRAWAERGITRLAPEQAATLRAPDESAATLRAHLSEPLPAEDYGYVPAGPIFFAEDEPRPHPR